MKLKLKKSDSGWWFFILVARNGQTLMTSEMYTRKASAIKTMMSILRRRVEV